MKKRHENYYEAVAVMIGYIVGVGVFSLPFFTAKSGLIVFLVLLFGLGAVQYFIHLIYANLIIITKNFHRMPGYIEIYLGTKGKIVVFVAKMIGNTGALVAYIIITGIFLYELLGSTFGGSPFIYASIIFWIEALIVFLGLKMIAKFELVMSGLLLLAVALIVWKGSQVISLENYMAIDWKYALLPFGAMLVALDGNGALPMVGKLIHKDSNHFKSVIRTSMLISFSVTLIFSLAVVGITGSDTTPDSLSGVKAALNGGVVVLALVFGLFSIITSVLGVAESVKETLWWDFKINKHLAWAITVIVPYSLYVFGIDNLSAVISFIGAVGGGFSAIMLIVVFLKIKKQSHLLPMFKKTPKSIWMYVLILLFLVGIFYEIYNFII